MNFFKYDSWAVVAKDYSMNGNAYSIINFLKKNGYKVIGIDSDKNINSCNINLYESLKDVPHNIDVVVIVDEIIETYAILDEMELLDINNIWFEQNSYNELMIKKAKSSKLNVAYGISLSRELNRY
ncbi:MAG: CoA-binding protein [Romboutsia sp.]|uniref:CoA-binding protein n=1 Tax=Romboutsia sp. TaxID=1965302 RepID=UPI003F39DC1A